MTKRFADHVGNGMRVGLRNERRSVDDPAITKAWDQQMFLPELAAGAQVDACK